jgi:hypothetical protein
MEHMHRRFFMHLSSPSAGDASYCFSCLVILAPALLTGTARAMMLQQAAKAGTGRCLHKKMLDLSLFLWGKDENDKSLNQFVLDLFRENHANPVAYHHIIHLWET